MSWGYDIAAVIRGLRSVLRAGTKLQENYYRRIWRNSSARAVTQSAGGFVNARINKAIIDPETELKDNINRVRETAQRIDVFLEGLKRYVFLKFNLQENTSSKNIPHMTLEEVEDLLRKRGKLPSESYAWDPKEIKQFTGYKKGFVVHNHQFPKEALIETEKSLEEEEDENPIIIEPNLPKLSESAKQRRVPSTRIERMASFGGLAATLGLRTLSELAKGAVGIGDATTVKKALLSPDNATKIVDTLCKVRGAALKLGQILSIQDDSVIAPELAAIFERVRNSADYMPLEQVESVFKSEFGEKWKELLVEFDEKPFAAASIGQVHYAVLNNGTTVAIKVQYPGVARGIESDIDNLVGLLNVWDVFPQGMFIDKIIKVAKHELAWEVDYEREAINSERYYDYFSIYPEYVIPKVIRSLSSAQVLTTELMPGVSIDQCFELPYEDRHMIAYSIMKLCLRELFVYRFMQTDPNWSNFLYIKETKQIALIDFGATRDYSKEFIDNYLRVIKAATDGDRDLVRTLSEHMGFLTGYESQSMRDAHIDAVMILGEVFSCKGEFDFGNQSTTKRIAALVPVMVSQRLCPPPEEIYSLHRKLSGVFLMCAKLNVKLSCRRMFEEVYNNYKFSD